MKKRTKRVKKVRLKKLTRIGKLELSLERAVNTVKRLDSELAESIRDRRALQGRLAKLHLEQHNKPVYVWITNEGQRMEPKAMDDRHLQNCICYLQRRLTRMFGEVTWLRGTQKYVQALYEMLKEAERRGLAV